MVVVRNARRHLRRNGRDRDGSSVAGISGAAAGLLVRQGLVFTAITAIAATAARRRQSARHAADVHRRTGSVIASYRQPFDRPSLRPRRGPPSCCCGASFGWGWVHHRMMVALSAALLTTVPPLQPPRPDRVHRVRRAVRLPELRSASPREALLPHGYSGVRSWERSDATGGWRTIRRVGHRAPSCRLARLRPAHLVSLLVAMAYGRRTSHGSATSRRTCCSRRRRSWRTTPRQPGATVHCAGCSCIAGIAAPRRSLPSGCPTGNRRVLARLALPTFLLGAALFAYAMAVVLEGENRRLGWPARVRDPGRPDRDRTRSTLILVVVPLAIIVGARRHFARRSIRFAIMIPAVALLVAARAFRALISLTGADRAAFPSRIELVAPDGQVFGSELQDRLAQTQVAWDAFQESPCSASDPAISSSGSIRPAINMSATVIDSPAEYLAKFGLVGLWPLVVLVWAVGANACGCFDCEQAADRPQLADRRPRRRVRQPGGPSESRSTTKDSRAASCSCSRSRSARRRCAPGLRERAGVSAASILVVALGDRAGAAARRSRRCERRFDPFEPIVIFALAYGVMFVARPAAMLVTGDLSYCGVDIRSTIPRMLVLALTGGVAFVCGYELRAAVLLAACAAASSRDPTSVGIVGAAIMIAARARRGVRHASGPSAARDASRSCSGVGAGRRCTSSRREVVSLDGAMLVAPPALLLLALGLRERRRCASGRRRAHHGGRADPDGAARQSHVHPAACGRFVTFWYVSRAHGRGSRRSWRSSCSPSSRRTH